jgi:hypothetical protein
LKRTIKTISKTEVIKDLKYLKNNFLEWDTLDYQVMLDRAIEFLEALPPMAIVDGMPVYYTVTMIKDKLWKEKDDGD